MTNNAIVRPLGRARAFSVCRLWFHLRSGFLMTSHAIVHGERLERSPQRLIECFYRTVAGLTFNLCDRNVDPVREKNMWRQPPDSLPRDLLVFFTVRFNFFDLWVLRLHGTMATHAHSDRRPSGDDIRFDSYMTGTAGEALCDVFFVRELDRLFNPSCTPTCPEKQHHRSRCKEEC